MPVYRQNLGRRLTAVEADGNIRELDDKIAVLQSDRPQPARIESVSTVGSAMTWHMSDGTEIGPITLPVLSFKWRGAWTPFTLFDGLDTFIVENTGLYSVLRPHTSGATFDPGLLVDDEPALQKIWGFQPSDTSIVYDLEFQYNGVLSDATSPLVSFLALRPFSVPASVPGLHLAYLVVAPSTAQQVLPILHGATQIGTVTWEIGENDGTIVIGADENFAFGDHLYIGEPSTPDATAAGMTVALAARRIIA
jgi:hypothetical protein